MANKFTAIANHLYAQATQYPDFADNHAEPALFFIDGVMIKCRPTKIAIQRVADKYDAGPVKGCRVINKRTGCRQPTAPRLSGAALAKFKAEALANGDIFDDGTLEAAAA